jgi:hypothetical protein
MKSPLKWKSIMIVKYFQLSALLLIGLLLLPGIITAGEIKGAKNPEYVPSKILVKFYSGVPDENKAAVRKKFGVEAIKLLKKISAEVWALPDGKSIDEVINGLKKESSVEYSVPNYMYEPNPAPKDSNSYEKRRLNPIASSFFIRLFR